MQKVCVQGLGFVGSAMATAVAIASDDYGELIYDVVGVDLPNKIGDSRVSAINQGKFPFSISDDRLLLAVSKAHKNGNLRATTDQNEYSQADIVVVDGIERVECIRALIPVVKASCVIILDDSDDVEERTGASYVEGIDLLTGNGYKRIDFRSFKSLAVDQYQTSIFYNSGNNCLDL